jgi:alkylation response protein AidB-like acyl-CoA dehydrogenase
MLSFCTRTLTLDFDFSDDQKFLRDEARKFLEAKCTSALVRGVLDNDDVSHSADLWSQVKDMGWLGVAIPEEFGGLGLGMLEMCVIAEELGRVLAPVPFGSSAFFFAEAVKLYGTADQKREYLPKIASGEFIGCLATSEGPGALDAAKLQTNFAAGKISGSKLPVTDGDIATHAVVLVRDGGATSLVVAMLDAGGVTRNVLKTLEPTRSHAEIIFDDADAILLGDASGNGLSQLEQVLNRGAILLAFEQLGGASRCLEMAVSYANERKAFGRPIGGYQAIKHKLADMYVKNEVARSNAYYGAWALSTGAAELPEAAAAARVAASEAFWYASKENIQTHGGMGFTWEVDCHLYYRRAKMLSVQVGSPAVWKEKLVSALERRNAA